MKIWSIVLEMWNCKKREKETVFHTQQVSLYSSVSTDTREWIGENSGPSLHHVSWIDLEAVDDLLGPADYSVSESWPSLDCLQENCCRHQHTLEKHSVSHNIARGRHAMRHHCGKNVRRDIRILSAYTWNDCAENYWKIDTLASTVGRLNPIPDDVSCHHARFHESKKLSRPSQEGLTVITHDRHRELSGSRWLPFWLTGLLAQPKDCRPSLTCKYFQPENMWKSGRRRLSSYYNVSGTESNNSLVFKQVKEWIDDFIPSAPLLLRRLIWGGQGSQGPGFHILGNHMTLGPEGRLRTGSLGTPCRQYLPWNLNNPRQQQCGDGRTLTSNRTHVKSILISKQILLIALCKTNL